MTSFANTGQCGNKSGVAITLSLCLSTAACGMAPPELNRETEADQQTRLPSVSQPAVSLLLTWLEESVCLESAAVRGLCHAYFDTESHKPFFISTMVSAEVARFLARLGDIEGATEAVQTLLRWQHSGEGPAGDRLRYAVPSEILSTKDRYVANYLYDTGDNLAVIEALLDVFELTHRAELLTGAARIGEWLRDVMAHGERYGLWTEPLGLPMKAVTSSGAFDNRIALGRLAYWASTLRRLGALLEDESFGQLADQSESFLRRGQHRDGGYYDHYDPGYPPVSYHGSRFRPYTGSLVVADDSLRAATAAAAAKDAGAVRFWSWLRPQGACVPGYLEVTNGQSDAGSQTGDYCDVISTALLRALARALQRPLDEEAVEAFLAQAQDPNGGFFWGWSLSQNRPQDEVQSTLTGLWAVMDLSPTRISKP